MLESPLESLETDTMAKANIRVTLGTYDGWIYGWEPTTATTEEVDPSRQSLADMLNSASAKSTTTADGKRLDNGGMSLVYA